MILWESEAISKRCRSIDGWRCGAIIYARNEWQKNYRNCWCATIRSNTVQIRTRIWRKMYLRTHRYSQSLLDRSRWWKILRISRMNKVKQRFMARDNHGQLVFGRFGVFYFYGSEKIPECETAFHKWMGTF